MVKVVVNRGYGGYGLSHAAVMRYAELKGIMLHPYIDDITKSVYKERAVVGNPEILVHYTTEKLPENPTNEQINKHYFSETDIPRDDPILIKVIEELGVGVAGGRHTKLEIVEIPDGIEYEISDYDGIESIHEKHRSW